MSFVYNLKLQDIEINNLTQRTTAHIGQKGTGKTTLIRMLIEKINGSMPGIIFDPLNVVETPIKYVVNKKSLSFGGLSAKLANRHFEKKQIVVIGFHELLGNEIVAFIDTFIPQLKLQNGLMVFDEIHEFTPQTGGAYSNEVERYIRHCRNKNVGIWMTTQRPAFANKNVLALSDFYVLFRVTYPNDLEVMKKLISRAPNYEEILTRIQSKGFLEGYTLDFDPMAGKFIK